jgi:hypothetical protein
MRGVSTLQDNATGALVGRPSGKGSTGALHPEVGKLAVDPADQG